MVTRALRATRCACSRRPSRVALIIGAVGADQAYVMPVVDPASSACSRSSTPTTAACGPWCGRSSCRRRVPARRRSRADRPARQARDGRVGRDHRPSASAAGKTAGDRLHVHGLSNRPHTLWAGADRRRVPRHGVARRRPAHRAAAARVAAPASDAQRALIGSGFVVFCQFALFLCIGIGLWAFYRRRDLPGDRLRSSRRSSSRRCRPGSSG